MFDSIVDLDLFHKVHGSINFLKDTIEYDSGKETTIFFKLQDINHLQLRNESIPVSIKKKYASIIKRVFELFEDSKENLPYNTNVVFTIRTNDDEPTYEKFYPYQLGKLNKKNQRRFVSHSKCRVILSRLGKAHLFRTLGLKSGLAHIELDERVDNFI